MSPADRATLLHAAELLEERARAFSIAMAVAPNYLQPFRDDLLATARALREMANG